MKWFKWFPTILWFISSFLILHYVTYTCNDLAGEKLIFLVAGSGLGMVLGYLQKGLFESNEKRQ